MNKTAAETDVLLVENLGDIGRVTLNRPARLNALNQPLTEALFAYFEGLRRNRDTRVVILRGAGGPGEPEPGGRLRDRGTGPDADARPALNRRILPRGLECGRIMAAFTLPWRNFARV